ncbi:aldehyde dehydrogenase family protein [Bdellovibrionota bacterium FG-1]
MEIKGLQDTLRALEIQNTNPGVCDGESWFGSGSEIEVRSPINGQVIAHVKQGTPADYEKVMAASLRAFKTWREVPAPKRGEVVRQLGDALRALKEPLGRLVSIEMGKIYQEGLGEVQEMIDICDMACGQSRMLHGVQTHSERPRHRMYEQWHPIGVVGIISAFNFPVAVWSWNATIALIAGDTCVWKPASTTPLTAIACQKIIQKVLRNNGVDPAVATLITGKGSEVGELFNQDHRMPLVSYTGSTRLGKHIGKVVGERLGRTILELGGNNAIIITKNADLALATGSVFFGAIGTAGQRCTSTRRVIVEESVYNDFRDRLNRAYDRITIGSSLDEKNLMGPLAEKSSVEAFFTSIEQVKKQGGTFLRQGERLSGPGYEGGCYVRPAIAEVNGNLAIVQEETFAPLLYLMKYSGALENAIALQNEVPQGLSSAIFTNDMRESELFLSSVGSDCGIANVNVGTSGAEIGLAFGGEKETGGGRESGSDAWKTYMRRQTNTVNWSGKTILAQGVKFE